MGKIENLLATNAQIHGKQALSLFAGLYVELAGITPVQQQSISKKEDISRNLDTRVETEWRKFAIPDFDRAASTNATHKNTHEFVALLEGWSPATTNGVAAKARLYVNVTNSVPKWRTTYEHSTFEARIGNAVKSGALEDLAALYPQRVVQRGETNDYLTVAYVSEQWAQRLKGEFETAKAIFARDILKSVGDRVQGKRPYFSDSERDRIAKKARQVGKPFDDAAFLHEIEKEVAAMAATWDSAKREACTKWVRANVRSDRKRTGRNSLWDDYETFMRSNRDNNPFATNIVRLSVYQQVEKWFEEDVSKFKQLKSSSGDYADEVKNAFEPFKNLCRDVYRDKNPLKTSWAWYFACDCVDKGQIDSATTCFPQRLDVTIIEGKIEYEDYRSTYKGTELSADIFLEQFEGEPNFQELFKYKLNKNHNNQWTLMPFHQTSYLFHPFDVVDIRLFAEDQIRVGRNLKCQVKSLGFKGIELGEQNWESGVIAGGEFDLREKTLTKYARNHLTTKDPTPDAYIKICGKISGDAIGDFLKKAKKKAEQEMSKGK